jgi:biotin-(acetyl-CoA carboxylase) ligase
VIDALRAAEAGADAPAEGGGGELVGTVRGIAPDGALLVERDRGDVCRVIAGDVTLAKEDAG